MRRVAAGWARPAQYLGLALGAALALAPLGAARQAELPLRPCTLAGAVAARCGTFTVPENRDLANGRTIRLRVAVVPARDGGSRPDPLVYLAGGPGGSAVAGAAGVLSSFAAVHETRDILLVDQRGTGGSNRLACPAPRAPLRTATVVRAYVEACLARFDADPRQYTTVPAMEDLADVIRALGYAQVNVYGGSYGATAAQYFLALHPELVRTVILDGGTLLDVPIFELWGRNGERALRAILARCAAAPRCARAYPRVRREAFEMIAALRRKPVQDNDTVIDAASAAGTLQALSRSPEGAGRIPWIAHQALAGDWTPLELSIDEQGSGGLETRQLMFWSIVCNEPWARWNAARTAAASRGTYLAERTALDARLAAAVCSVFPKVAQPAWSKSRVRSELPVLLVVGGSDPQDPLANVRNASHELPASRTIVVPAGGHGSIQVGCMPRLALEFVEHASASGLDASCAARFILPRFVVR